MINLHVLGLAHLPTIAADPVMACAYSQKIRRFCDMMSQDYNIIFYGVEGSRVNAKEIVICLSEEDRCRIYGPLENFSKQFYKHDGQDEAYKIFKQNASREIKARVEKGDIFCNPMGNYYQELCQPVSKDGLGIEVANGYPFIVESGIGYDGILQNTHRVFESNAWRHYVYGIYKCFTQSKNFVNGDFYDTVIPNFYVPEHYKFRDSKEDFFFMNCRIAHRKGINIAIETVKVTGDKLIIAGQPGEDVDMNYPNVEYIGYIDEKTKIDLLSHAKGLFSPTRYIGPFEGVAVEAQMSGCPVITTDFGCYTETVNHGVTGFRCNTLKDFVSAARHISSIDPLQCVDWAKQFSVDVCREKYDNYFKRLSDLWKKGWFEL